VNPDPGLASWLQLALTPGLGPVSVQRLLQQFGLPQNALARNRRELAAHVPPAALAALDSHPVALAVKRSLAWAEQPGHSIVTLADEGYPRSLLEIPDPPPLLFARGRLELLARPALAIVGSRNATQQGEANAESFAKALSDAGLAIVSGLALGIDAAAHRGGLAGAGSTIAVLGTGIDVLYPARNAGLAEHIAQQGLILSEFALGTAPAAHNFPRRNRLISGLARGCLVVDHVVEEWLNLDATVVIGIARRARLQPGPQVIDVVRRARL